MAADPVDPDDPRRAGPQRAADPAPARPRRPRRHAEVRLRRGPARSWSGPAPARPPPGSRSARSPAPTSRRRPGIEIVSHVVELAAAKAPYGVLPEPADVERLDADPVRCLDADASKAMVAEIDQAHKDGDTLGGVVEVLAYGVPRGPRLARALGPPARRPARRRPDGHPGHQGRRGRRRLRPGPRARARRRTTRSSPTDDGIRRASGRSGGTEGGMTTGELLRVRAAMKPIATVPRALATVDVATGEAGQGAPPALRRLRGARPPASSPRRWWRWCSPTPSRRSSAATAWPRPAATSRPTSTTWSSGERGSAAAAVVVLVGPDGRRQVHGGRAARRAARRRLPGHRRRHRGQRPASRSPTSSSTTASRTSATLERAAVRDALAEHAGVLALGGGAVLDDGDPRAAGRAAGGLPGDGASRRRSGGSASTRRGRCSPVNPRPAVERADGGAPAALHRGRPRGRRHRRPHPRRGRRGGSTRWSLHVRSGSEGR